MTILKYPGSKQQCADWIISHFPDNYQNYTYLEPFFGSGQVFFRKNRSVVETINDIDGNVFNLFLQIRENPERLAFLIHNTPWSRDEYILSTKSSGNPEEKARRFIVRMWFSIGARPRDKNGFRNNIAGNNGNLTSFHTKLPEKIVEISSRLKSTSGRIVQIENLDAAKLIKKYNRDNVLIYLDPPYLLSTRKNRKIYFHEMEDADHEELLNTIKESKAKIIISGYDHDLYNRHLSNWNKASKKVRDEKQNLRTECIWMNYAPPQYLFNTFEDINA